MMKPILPLLSILVLSTPTLADHPKAPRAIECVGYKKMCSPGDKCVLSVNHRNGLCVKDKSPHAPRCRGFMGKNTTLPPSISQACRHAN